MTKNVIRVILLPLIVCLPLGLFACGMPGNIPENGIFFCEDLNISIDFSIIDANPECGKVYAADGSYTTCRCMIDYGFGISICSSDQNIDYLIGKYQYKDDLFYVTAYDDGTVYVFERVLE